MKNTNTLQLEIYLVGGAVRDMCLGRHAKDLDYVVVGATAEWMLAQGFKQVGADFPVFLHPETGEEYALARRERKSGQGYHGFVCEFDASVTLEEDLSRRDLTMNAMAFGPMHHDVSKRVMIDPFNGMDDMVNGVIRHTSAAFSEDPLRVLRVARFVARYGFTVSSDTAHLCRHLLASGELNTLSKERIWAEFNKLFSEDYPSKGLDFLRSVGAAEHATLVAPWLSVQTIDFDGIYLNDVEKMLSPTEKLLLETDMATWSPAQANHLCVPSAVLRSVKFFDQVYNRLFGGMMDCAAGAEDIVSVFDKFREEFRQGKLAEVAGLAKKLDPDYPSEVFFNNLERTTQALLHLNFSDLAKGKRPDEIKRLVHESGLAVVEREMAGGLLASLSP